MRVQVDKGSFTMGLDTMWILLLVLVCPIAMVLMMRGGGNSHSMHDSAHGSDRNVDDAVRGMSDEQIEDLVGRVAEERERRSHDYGRSH